MWVNWDTVSKRDRDWLVREVRSPPLFYWTEPLNK